MFRGLRSEISSRVKKRRVDTSIRAGPGSYWLWGNVIFHLTLVTRDRLWVCLPRKVEEILGRLESISWFFIFLRRVITILELFYHCMQLFYFPSTLCGGKTNELV